MSTNQRRIIEALKDAGWTRKRQGNGSHEIWCCPAACGVHMVSVPVSSKNADAGRRSSPILKRIEDCQKALAAKAPPLVLPPQPAPPAPPRPAPPKPKPTPPVPRQPIPPPEPTPEPTTLEAPVTPPTAPAIARTITRVDGFAVVATEPAADQHPRWPDRTYTPEGVVKVLLETGEETHVCLGCDFHNVKVRSVVVHYREAHVRTTPRPPLTPPEVIRKVVRVVEILRAQKVKGYCEAAAAELNKTNIRPSAGRQWTAPAIHYLYSRYKDDPAYKATRIRIPKEKTMPPTTTAPAVSGVAAADLPAKLREIAVALETLGKAILDLADQAAATPAVDPEVAAKAAKYDQMRGLLGS